MRYELQLRARAHPEEVIAEKHHSFLSGLAKLGPPWVQAPASIPAAPDPGSELVVEVGLSGVLGLGLRGSVLYQFRRKFRDEAAADDVLSIEFNPRRLDPGMFGAVVFPHLIETFRAYRGEMGDIELAYRDYDRTRGIDFRHGVDRIYPFSFFDRELCRRAFGLSPREIRGRLEGKCEAVLEALDGIEIVLASAPITVTEADRLSALVLGALGRNGMQGR